MTAIGSVFVALIITIPIGSWFDNRVPFVASLSQY